jgi:DNA-binding NarL/FixJ family response regulator
MSVRVLLADDHSDFRKVVRELLESDAGIAVVAEAANGDELLNIAPQKAPDIVCLDVSMPGINGLQATQRLIASAPRIRVIAISGYADETYVHGMLDAGARAYLLKEEVGEHLIPAIRIVQQGETYLGPQAAAAVTEAAGGSAPERPAPAVRLEARERQVLKLIASGLDTARIAERLQMSPTTVQVHCRNMMRKLDLHGDAELARYAAAYADDGASAPGSLE